MEVLTPDLLTFNLIPGATLKLLRILIATTLSLSGWSCLDQTKNSHSNSKAPLSELAGYTLDG